MKRGLVLLAAALALPACGESGGGASGPAAFVWTAQNPANVPIVTAVDNQGLPRSVSDGAGGAIIVWADRRNGSTSEIYAQRVSSNGTPLWAVDGVAVCVGTDARLPRLAADGAGGVVATWQDGRNGNNDVYAQGVGPGGPP